MSTNSPLNPLDHQGVTQIGQPVPSRLWMMSAIAGFGDQQPRKPSAFSGVTQVEKTLDGFFEGQLANLLFDHDALDSVSGDGRPGLAAKLANGGVQIADDVLGTDRDAGRGTEKDSVDRVSRAVPCDGHAGEHGADRATGGKDACVGESGDTVACDSDVPGSGQPETVGVAAENVARESRSGERAAGIASRDSTAHAVSQARDTTDDGVGAR